MEQPYGNKLITIKTFEFNGRLYYEVLEAAKWLGTSDGRLSEYCRRGQCEVIRGLPAIVIEAFTDPLTKQTYLPKEAAEQIANQLNLVETWLNKRFHAKEDKRSPEKFSI